MTVELSVGFPGERYGKLVIIEEAERRRGCRYVRCQCNCGGETIVRLSHIRSGQIKTCGCGQGRLIHGMAGTTEYKSWTHFRSRCLNPDDPAYGDYGGRGITVFKKWITDFQAFYDHIGPKPGPGYSVDRIDNDQGYAPGNVRWATQKTQARNSRWNRILTYKGESHPLIVWVERLGISNNTLTSRLNRGWSTEKALSTPVKEKTRTRRGRLEFDGRCMSIPQWAEEVGIPFKTISSRLNRGWSAKEALTVKPAIGSNQTLRAKTPTILIGCDECGTGPISGPVVTAAVVLPVDKTFEGLRDSKKMSPSDREWLAVKIKEQALGWVIAGSTAKQIDKYGISACRWFCMGMCANECLKRYPESKVIVDGNQLIAGIPRVCQEAVVKADDKFQVVSAASVIGKVCRDHMMVKLWERHPQYDWKKNMGYPTRDHLVALRKYGVSPHHRRSYGPVKKQLAREKASDH